MKYMISLIFSLFMIGSSFAAETYEVGNTIDMGNIITTEDPSYLDGISYIGQGTILHFCVIGGSGQENVYQYEAYYYGNQYTTVINFRKEDFSLEETKYWVDKISYIAGQLPEFLHTHNGIKKIDFVRDDNSRGIAAIPWAKDPVICLSTGAFNETKESRWNAVDKIRHSFRLVDAVEEKMIHEAVHTSLEYIFKYYYFYSLNERTHGQEYNGKTFLQRAYEIAKANDPIAITGYAWDHNSEDVAESLTAWTFLNYYPVRLSEGMKQHIRTTIPNRLNVFDHYFKGAELNPVVLNTIEGGNYENGMLNLKNIRVGEDHYDVQLEHTHDTTFELKHYERSN